MNDDPLQKVRERIARLEKQQIDVIHYAELVAQLFEADPHQFSTRPCQTCLTISVLVQRPFGCRAKAEKGKL